MSLLCVRNQPSLTGVAVTLYCQAVFSGEPSFPGDLAAGFTPLLASPTNCRTGFLCPTSDSCCPCPPLPLGFLGVPGWAEASPRDLGSPSGPTPPHYSLPFRPCPHLSFHKSSHVPSWLDPEFTSPRPPQPPRPPSPGSHHVAASLPPVCPLTITFSLSPCGFS